MSLFSGEVFGQSYSTVCGFDDVLTWGELVGSNGVLYGVSSVGGDGGASGFVFRVRTNGTSFSILHEFRLGSEGGTPAGLALSGDTLYGITLLSEGGTENGTIFKVKTNGLGFATLHVFDGERGGKTPVSLVLNGNALYGTTFEGGASQLRGWGTVFKMNLDGTGFTILHSFANVDLPMHTNAEGAYPRGRLLVTNNTIYGTTGYAGAYERGTVFKMGTSGSGFTVLLHLFQPGNLESPQECSGLILAGDGLYGTSYYGGENRCGTVFKLGVNAGGFTVLHSFSSEFSDDSGGSKPRGGLTLRDNVLYGTTWWGGSAMAGTVFKIGTDGSGFATIHEFARNETDGGNPNAGLLLMDDTLYGTTEAGGPGINGGTLFKLAFPKTASAPAILSQPSAVCATNGAQAVFSVSVSGTGPLWFRWYRNGTAVTNGTRITGATTESLVINNLTAADEGNYSVVVANSIGSVTSSNAALSLLYDANSFYGGQFFYTQNLVSNESARTVTYTKVSGIYNVIDGSWTETYRGTTTDYVNDADQVRNLSQILLSGAFFKRFSGLPAWVQDGATLGNYLGIFTNGFANYLAARSLFLCKSLGGSDLAGFRFSRHPTITLDDDTIHWINPETNAYYYPIVLCPGGQFTIRGQFFFSMGAVIDPPITDVRFIDSKGYVHMVSSLDAVVYQDARRATLKVSTELDPHRPITETYRVEVNCQHSGVMNCSGSSSVYRQAYPFVTVNWDANAAPALVTQPLDVSAASGNRVDFSVIASGAVPLAFQWLKNGVRLSDGPLLSGIRSNSLVLSNISRANEGSYSVMVSNAFGVVVSSNAVLRVFQRETIRPTLSIASPAAGLRTTNEALPFRGTARDNQSVTSVWCQVNDGPFVRASGSNSWSMPVTLVPGTNRLCAYAVDGSGNCSSTNRVQLVRVLTSRLSVQKQGNGRLTPDYDGKSLEIGKSYMLTAEPASGFALINWADESGAVLTNGVRLRFIMRSNLEGCIAAERAH